MTAAAQARRPASLPPSEPVRRSWCPFWRRGERNRASDRGVRWRPSMTINHPGWMTCPLTAGLFFCGRAVAASRTGVRSQFFGGLAQDRWSQLELNARHPPGQGLGPFPREGGILTPPAAYGLTSAGPGDGGGGPCMCSRGPSPFPGGCASAAYLGSSQPLTPAPGRKSRPFGRPPGTKPGIAALPGVQILPWTRMESIPGTLAPPTLRGFLLAGVAG